MIAQGIAAYLKPKLAKPTPDKSEQATSNRPNRLSYPSYPLITASAHVIGHVVIGLAAILLLTESHARKAKPSDNQAQAINWQGLDQPHSHRLLTPCQADPNHPVRACTIRQALPASPSLIHQAETDVELVYQALLKQLQATPKDHQREQALWRAIKHTPKQLPPTSAKQNQALRRLAHWLARLGDQPRAASILETLRQREPEQASNTLELASVYLKQHRYRAAEGLFKRALAQIKASTGLYKPAQQQAQQQALSLIWLGRTAAAIDQQRWIAAKAYLRHAKKTLQPDNRIGQIVYQDYKALIQSQLGLPAKLNVERRQQQLETIEQQLGQHHPRCQIARASLAIALAHLDNRDPSTEIANKDQRLLQTLEQLRTTRQRLNRRTLNSATPKTLRHASAHQLLSERDLLLSLALRKPLRHSNDALTEVATSDLFNWQGIEADQQRLAKRRQQLRKKLAKVYPKANFLNAQRKHRLIDQIDHNTAAITAVIDTQQQQRLNAPISLYQAAIDNKTAILDLRAYLRLDLRRNALNQNHWIAAVVEQNQPPTLQDLGPISQTWPMMARGSRGPKQLKPDDLKHMGHTLFEPLQDQLRNANTLYLISDGLARSFPLEAVQNSKGQTIIDTHQFIYLINARTLLGPEKPSHDTTQTKPKQRHQAQAILIGDLDYGDNDDKKHKPAFPKLTETLREILGIASEIKRARWGKLHIWRGRKATEQQLQQLSSSPNVLHLSTHGFNFRWQHTPNTPTDPPTGGLALSNANRAADYPRDRNGILDNQEVANLPLDNTRLVVLSSCHTGIGQLDPVEGSDDMARAFSIAGAKYLIASRWNVSDTTAATFMLHFYRQWLKRPQQSPVRAFHQTQRDFEGYADRYQHQDLSWAAFTLYRLN